MILFLDFEKAFDSLEREYLVEVLDAMNFGSNFRKWISTFYHNISTVNTIRNSILPLLTMRKRLTVYGRRVYGRTSTVTTTCGEQ